MENGDQRRVPAGADPPGSMIIAHPDVEDRRRKPDQGSPKVEIEQGDLQLEAAPIYDRRGEKQGKSPIERQKNAGERRRIETLNITISQSYI